MAAKNDITGDAIRSKALSEKGRDNWDKIFNKEFKGTDMWYHLCKHNGPIDVARGESCSWCGMKENGAVD